MPKVDAFERTACRVRRTVRSLPLLEPMVNRAGMWLWRRHLDRLAREEGLALPRRVPLDPALVHRRLDPAALPTPRPSGDAPEPAEQGGSWDGGALPLEGGDDHGTDDDGPVRVVFDRLGRPCLVGGHRALEEARRAGRQADARVVLCHPRWARLARRVMAYAELRGGSAYQPYLHPDLAAVPSDQGHERFPTLVDALPVYSGTLVDLGANGGYFSHRFEAAGFRCFAVERSEKEAYFLIALRDALERDFTVLKGSLTEVPLPRRVDVVLAVNIFHHFLKTEASFQELHRFLGRLDARYVLFEPHLPGDPQMRHAAHDLEPDEFAAFVADAAGLERVRRLGTADDGRPLYLLSAAGERQR